MRKPPHRRHGVAWNDLSQRKRSPSAPFWLRRVTRVSVLPHRTQYASWVFMVLVYIRFATTFPLLRSGDLAGGRQPRNAEAAESSSRVTA